MKARFRRREPIFKFASNAKPDAIDGEPGAQCYQVFLSQNACVLLIVFCLISDDRSGIQDDAKMGGKLKRNSESILKRAVTHTRTSALSTVQSVKGRDHYDE